MDLVAIVSILGWRSFLSSYRTSYLVLRLTYSSIMVTQESYKGRALCFILIVVCCTIFVGQLNEAIIIGKFGTGQSKTPRLILTRK